MSQKRDLYGLVVLWLAATSYNLFKPYQIDDGADLIIATWIRHHPWHPMRGMLNWTGFAAPIWHTNQPHLYFYVLALWGYLFGIGEPATHLLQSLFAAGAVGLFYRIARRLAAADALWLTAMLVLNPAFIVEQNLMVDVPLLSMWLGFFEALLCRMDDPRQHRRFALAGAFAACAMLIKYSSLVLLPIMLVTLVMERRRAQAWSVAIPLLALAGWSLFNWLDYGGVHLITAFHDGEKPYRAAAHEHFTAARKLVKTTIAWGMAAGALSPFGIIALAERSRYRRWVYAGLFAGLVSLAFAVSTGFVTPAAAGRLLLFGFAVSGVALGVRLWRPDGFDARAIYLWLWIAGTSMFYVLFAPFIAARHILLILPAIALTVTIRRRPGMAARVFGLMMSVILASGLCVSDFRFAAFYRNEARMMAGSLPPRAVIWVAGHWGWQYYATQAGLREVDIHKSYLARGDYLAIPREALHELPKGLHLRWIRTDTGRLAAFDPFCTARPARFYLSSDRFGPWSLSAGCTQHIDIFSVQ